MSFAVSNSLVSIVFDGRHAPTVSLGAPYEGAGVGGSVELVLYEDRPIMWDAWDIDHYYPEKLARGIPQSECRVIESTALRVIVEQDVLVRDLLVTQRWTLCAGSPRIDITHRLDWRRSHQLLRLRVTHPSPANARCTHAVHFGAQTRPIHGNTAHERARFEFPAQGWIDVSHSGSPNLHEAGFALIAPTKFGFSCRPSATLDGTELGVSLLRAPTWPDPDADQGPHEFTVSVMPHAGSWRDAGVEHQSELARSGVHVIQGAGANPAKRWAPFTLITTGNARVRIAAFKLAEDNTDLIVRLYESSGAAGRCTIDWNLPVASVRTVDLLERNTQTFLSEHIHVGNQTSFTLKPFQIVTLRISRP